ncbi:MAG: DHH family phosphoesterase [Phycisphaera sp.]|nr:MAG: DHH family phosphoesterase [Phycisphaera sp.]
MTNATETAVYESTVSPGELVEWIQGAGRLLLITHARPDGDAVGSTLAIARAAKLAGVETSLAYAGELPPWMGDILGETEWVHLDAGDPPPAFDKVLVCDTGAWSQLEPYKPWIAGKADVVAVLDHHRSGSPDVAERRVVDSDAAAACEIAAEVCTLLLGMESPANLPLDIAEPLMLGLGTDTGWFRHPSVTPHVLRLAADLVQAGAQHPRLVKMTMLSDPIQRLKLMSKALGSLSLHENVVGVGGVAVVKVSAEDISSIGASVGMTSGFADPALSVRAVSVAIVLVELPPEGDGKQRVKISMRSKIDGPDVAKIAGAFGGGGHIRAAGARSDLSLDETEKKLLELIAQSKSE